MAFAASLTRFSDLVAKAIALTSPADGGGGESFPATMNKDSATMQFNGAIFHLKEAEGFAFAAPPSARQSATGVELVLSGANISSSRKYRKADWMDQHVTHWAASIIGDKVWQLGNTPTTFSIPKDGNEDAVFNELYVASGGTAPYKIRIIDLMSMGFHDGIFQDNGSASPMEWKEWVVRAAPAAAPLALVPSALPAAQLGAAGEAPRIILAALGVRPEAASGNYDTSHLGHLIATMGGSAAGSLAVSEMLGTNHPNHDEYTLELRQALDELHDVDPSTLADAATAAREAVLETPTAVPTPRAEILGDALRRALLSSPVQLKADDAEPEYADELEGESPDAVARPTDIEPGALAYIIELEARVRGFGAPALPAAGSPARPLTPGGLPSPAGLRRAGPPPRPRVTSSPAALPPPHSAAAASAALRAGRAGSGATPPPPPSQPLLEPVSRIGSPI